MAPTEPCCVRLFRTSPTAEAGRVAVGSGCPALERRKEQKRDERQGKSRPGLAKRHSDVCRSYKMPHLCFRSDSGKLLSRTFCPR